MRENLFPSDPHEHERQKIIADAYDTRNRTVKKIARSFVPWIVMVTLLLAIFNHLVHPFTN